MDKVIVKEFRGYRDTVHAVLDELGLEERLTGRDRIIIKPNLLQDTPPPCTTDVACAEAVAGYILEKGYRGQVMVLEGSGGCETSRAFRVLGYEKMAASLGIDLLDVDDAGLTRLEDAGACVYREIYLPEVLSGSFLISVPCLKDHSITGVTLSLKNLIGLLPEKHYGNYWSYRRSDVHRVGVDRAIEDLARYVDIGLSIIDGRLGQQGSHLPGGRQCNPSRNVIIGGYDPLEADRKGAQILGHDWRDIRHLVRLKGGHGE